MSGHNQPKIIVGSPCVIFNHIFTLIDLGVTLIFRIARRYAAGCAGRKKIVNIFENQEPIGFTGFFQAWQKDYDPNAKFDSMQAGL